MNLPSLDQSVGQGKPSWRMTSSSDESSTRLRLRVGTARPWDRKAISVLLGDQTGDDSDPGSEVRRVMTPRVKSAIQISDSPVAGSIFSTAALRPSNESLAWA